MYLFTLWASLDFWQFVVNTVDKEENMAWCLSWGEACRYPATYKNFPHRFCFVQLISFLWSFSFAFARGWPTCIYYGPLHAGIGSQQVNSLFHSHGQWGRRERVGETRKWKVCEKGGGAGKRKKEGRESLRRPSFSQCPPFLFSFLYRCSFVLSCEHVLWRNVICKPIRSCDLSL